MYTAPEIYEKRVVVGGDLGESIDDAGHGGLSSMASINGMAGDLRTFQSLPGVNGELSSMFQIADGDCRQMGKLTAPQMRAAINDAQSSYAFSEG